MTQEEFNKLSDKEQVLFLLGPNQKAADSESLIKGLSEEQVKALMSRFYKTEEICRCYTKLIRLYTD